MKRISTLLLTLILCLSMGACSRKTEPVSGTQENQTEAASPEETGKTNPESTDAAPAETTDAAQAPIALDLELVGPWHLDAEKNDLTAFADSLDLFPGYGEWGASMEIRGNGNISWYIGAEGWYGTYYVEDQTLHALLTSNLDQSSQNWDMRITSENGTAGLEMDYQDMTIYWTYGDRGDSEATPSGWEKATEDEPWKVTLAEDLFQKYGVLPEYYEHLGDGIYQVYVEVGGEIVPFVTVDSATGDYHG